MRRRCSDVGHEESPETIGGAEAGCSRESHFETVASRRPRVVDLSVKKKKRIGLDWNLDRRGLGL